MKETEENDKNGGQDYYKAIHNVVNHLKIKRTELEHEIACDEKQKASLLGELNKIEDKLSVINANLKKKSDFRKEYDKAIAQTEGHFTELVEKSENFLSMTRREVLALNQTVCNDLERSKDKQQDYKGIPINGNLRGNFNGCANGAEPLIESCPQPPAAVLTFSANGNQENCVNCTKVAPCTTIMIPFRANGL